MLLLWLAVTFVIVGLYDQSRRLNASARDRSRIEAVQQAEANARASECLHSRPALRRFDAFVTAVLDLHRALVVNAKAALDSTPRTDPLYNARLTAYLRLSQTISSIERARFYVPTLHACRARGGP